MLQFVTSAWWKWLEIDLKWLAVFIPEPRVFAKVALRRVPACQGLCLSNGLEDTVGFHGLWHVTDRSDASTSLLAHLFTSLQFLFNEFSLLFNSFLLFTFFICLFGILSLAANRVG